MKRIISLLLLSSFVIGVPFTLADDGMWTFDNPPLKQWKERYAFEPSQEWLDKVRLASPNIGGASGGFVSPNGLIATNHHVAAGYIGRLSTKERDLMKTGFYAKTQADELKIPDAEVAVLTSYENVTERVHGAAQTAAKDADAAKLRSTAIAGIEKDCVAATSLKCDVISFYSGGEYWLYRNKRYTDIRLVMAPEEQTAFFGGDYDNFVYPRHDLDFTFLRAYENGQPAKTPDYFKWSETGAADGEFILVSGYPGSTARLLTVAQLAYQRDVGNPLQKQVWETRRKALEEYSKIGAEQTRQASGGMRSFANSLKRLAGQQDGLLNPRNFAKKEAEEKDLREKLALKPELEKQYAPAWENIAKAYTGLPSMSKRLAFSNLAASRLATIAQQIVTHKIESAKPDDQRYAEYRDSRLTALKSSILSPAPIYIEMEEAALVSWLEEGVKVLGANDLFIKAAIGDAEPAEVARRAVRDTKLNDPAFRKTLFEGPATAVADSTDPMITLARRVEPIARELRTWNETNILNVEIANGTKIAQARFAVYGKSMPPDANSQLRIEYGVVKGYDEDTTLVPYKTTFFGLYDRALSFGEKHPFDLPQRVMDARTRVDLSTPLNFVYSADTIGGNSGSPVINRNGEIVGLNFDSNIQKLSNRYWYIEEAEGSRAVGVHSAGILEALRKVYDATELANELTGNQNGKSANIKAIDAYGKTIDEFVKANEKPHLVFADVSQTATPNWRKFASSTALERFRENTETYTIANNWQRDGKIVLSVFTLFSGSGDWAKYVYSYFRQDGTLAKVETNYRTFYGDFVYLERQYFDENGKLLAKSTEFKDLDMKEMRTPDKDYLSDNSPMMTRVDYYKSIDKLPYARIR